MLKSVLRLLLDRYGRHHGHRPSYPPAYGSHPYKPWKKGKKHRRPYGWHAGLGYGSGPYDDRPYGYQRPRGIKNLIIEAVLHRLLKR